MSVLDKRVAMKIIIGSSGKDVLTDIIRILQSNKQKEIKLTLREMIESIATEADYFLAGDSSEAWKVEQNHIKTQCSVLGKQLAKYFDGKDIVFINNYIIERKQEHIKRDSGNSTDLKWTYEFRFIENEIEELNCKIELDFKTKQFTYEFVKY